MTEASAGAVTPGAKRLHLVAFAGFVLLSVLFTWPLATSPFSHVIGHATREGVPPLNSWAMATVWGNLFTRPDALLQGTAFYPYDNSVAFSEHLLVPALLAGPVAAGSGSWTFAYNVSEFTALVLSGFFMFLLARALGASGMGAFLGGGLYAFNTWNINEIVRSQILSNEFFPLIVLACLRFAQMPSWSRAFAVGGAALLQALSCMYWAVYLPFLLIPVLVALLGLQGRAYLRAGLALLAAAALVLAVCWPYVSNGRQFGFEREEPQAVPLDRYFQVLPQNLLYGSFLEHGQPNQNAAHFQGFLAMALCLPGGLTLIRRRRRLAAALLLLSLFSLAASLGPEVWIAGRKIGPGIYGYLFEHVPVFHSIRYPERFAIFVNFTVAVLAALGLGALTRSRRMAAAVVVLALAEHLSIPQFLDEMPPRAQSREVYAAVRELPAGTVVAEVPAKRFHLERLDAILMFYSIEHGKRTLEGLTGYFPPLYFLSKWHLFHFPSQASLKFLSDLGVTAIVDRTKAEAPPGVTVLQSFDDGVKLLGLPRGASDSFLSDTFRSRAELEEIARDSWNIRLNDEATGSRILVDGDPRTAWSTNDAPEPGTFVRVRFSRAERLGRIRLFLPFSEAFPTEFEVEGITEGDSVPSLVFDRDWAFTSLARNLWKNPRASYMEIDVEPALVLGFRIRVTKKDAFRAPMVISEIRAFRAPPAPRVAPTEEDRFSHARRPDP